jgi:hypothetical protein
MTIQTVAEIAVLALCMVLLYKMLSSDDWEGM